ANFIALGDYNTMGMNLTYSDKDLSAAEEIERYRRRFAYKGMRLLSKSAGATWWNGPGSSYAPSDLDHAFASNHLQFTPFDGAEIAVRGWPEEPTDAAKQDWIDRHSDHALLYGEVVS